MNASASSTPFEYKTFSERNSGYIPSDVQEKIRNATLLIAGCGVGSSTAICAARMGFQRFVLVDGDTVGNTNLNRQFFDFEDIGTMKVDALKKHILRINPQAQVEAIPEYLNEQNTETIISKADIVFDTVDFLDLPAILRLHAITNGQKKHLFTALSVGFGAMIWYFPPNTTYPLSEALRADIEAASTGRDAGPTYADVFASFIKRLAPALDQEVLGDVKKVLAGMRESHPCPASQVAPGSFTVAAMATSAMRDVLSGNAYPSSPMLLIHSLKRHETVKLDVSKS